jgi:hypothetical protein
VQASTGEVKRGFYMDKWLAQNLELIPGHLKKGWDVVGIVSGTGMVRTGKSFGPATEILCFIDDKIVPKLISSFRDKEIINTISFDQYTGKIILSKSEVIVEKDNRDFYNVITDDGHIIQCTQQHKLFIRRDNQLLKIQLEDLKVGDQLVYSNIDKQIREEDILPEQANISWYAPEDPIRTICQYDPKYEKILRTSKIVSIEFFKKLKGYDLHTPEYHNFFLANGILSHNSTLAIQMCTFVDWAIQGGQMLWNDQGQVTGVIPPKKPLRFNLDHVLFTPDDLVKMTKLKGKREKNNVFLLDEGREGLLGARAMESVNKAIEDYFQTCGVYNNFIVIVLPDFFKLAEQYCVNRSLFLINVFHRNFERGYFSFFNTLQKERLYFFGKKRLGITARYNAASRNFWGRFSKWMPFDLKAYEDKKKFFIGKQKHSKLEVTHMRQRDLLTYVIRNRLGWTYEQISKELERYGEDTYGLDAVMRSLRNAERIINDAKFYADGEEEPLEESSGAPALKQEVDMTNLEQGATEKVREQLMNPGGVEYDNANVTIKNGAPITKVGPANTFIVKNSNDGINPETIDEEKLAMEASKFAAEEDMSKVAFSSSAGDPIFDQAKIDYYKVEAKRHNNPFEPDVYDNTSESGLVSGENSGGPEKVPDEDEDSTEDFEISEKDVDNSSTISGDQFISDNERENEEKLTDEENIEAKFRYNP